MKQNIIFVSFIVFMLSCFALAIYVADSSRLKCEQFSREIGAVKYIDSAIGCVAIMDEGSIKMDSKFLIESK